MPQAPRQALIADLLDLCFLQDGTRASVSRDRTASESKVYFVDMDGNLRNFTAAKNMYKNWERVKAAVIQVGKTDILKAIPREIQELVSANARYHLGKMPQIARDYALALGDGLLFMDDDSHPGGLQPEQSSSYTRWTYTPVKPNAKFISTLQSICTAGAVQNDHLDITIWCFRLVSRDTIANYYPRYLQTLRKHYHNRSAILEAAQKKEASKKLPHPPIAVGDNNVSDEAIQFVRSMDTITRNAFLAEHIGMLYHPRYGSFNYIYNLGHRWINPDVLFVASDGQSYDYHEVKMAETHIWNKGSEAWNAASPHFATQGQVDKLLSAFPDEVEKMALGTAGKILPLLPIVVRDALLAEFAGLLYTEDGASAYATSATTEYSPMGYPLKRPNFSPQARFVDSRGHEHFLSEIDPSTPTYTKFGAKITVLRLCAQIIGEDRILSLCPEIVDKMTFYRTNDASPIITTEETAKLLAAESSDTKAQLELVRKMPPITRDAFLAYASGLLYQIKSRDKYDIYHTRYKWINPEVIFVACDGNTYDFHSIMEEETKEWNTPSELWQVAEKSFCSSEEAKKILLSAFAEEVNRMAQLTAKKISELIPAQLRDALLAEFAGLLYLENGDTAPVTSEVTEYVNTLYLLHSKKYPLSSRFIDSAGKEHFRTDLSAYNHEYTKYKPKLIVLRLCAQQLGTDKLLALFPTELAKMTQYRTTAPKDKLPPNATPLPIK